MTIHLKTAEEIERMRIAGQLAGEVLDFVGPEELREVAMRHPEVFLGWQLLATLLATGVDSPGGDTWARELARLASPAPGQLLRQVGAFDVSDRAAVLEALRAEGVDLTSLLDPVWQAGVAVGLGAALGRTKLA